MTRLRDNQALRDEVRALVAASWNSADDDANSGLILDAVDRALTATGPGSGAGACCEVAERVQREDTTLLGYDCLEHGWQPRAAARRDAWKDLNALVTQAGGTIRCTPPPAPRTDHRAAPAVCRHPSRDEAGMCHTCGACQTCGETNCERLLCKGWLGIPEPATPPSGSPPAVTEPPTCERADGWEQSIPWPGPTLEMFNDDPVFDAIWQAIKRWDINVPGAYSGYMGATGNHVRAILDAINRLAPAAAPGEPVTSGSPPGAAGRDDGNGECRFCLGRPHPSSEPCKPGRAESPDGSRGTR